MGTLGVIQAKNGNFYFKGFLKPGQRMLLQLVSSIQPNKFVFLIIINMTFSCGRTVSVIFDRSYTKIEFLL